MTNKDGLSRRDFLKRGAALGGALVWVTPVVQVVGMRPAFAQTVSPGGATLVLEDVRLPSGTWGRLTGSGLKPGADVFKSSNEQPRTQFTGGGFIDSSGDLLIEELRSCGDNNQTGIFYDTLRADGTTISSNVEDQTTCPTV